MDVTASSDALVVLVYSDDADVRAKVRRALGSRTSKGAPPFDFHEFATEPAAIRMLDEGGVDLAILDGEASPVGGIGFARQIRDEIDGCPPVLLLIGRPDDAWLATWSRADAVVRHPIDPVALAGAVRDLLGDEVRAIPSAR